MTKKPRPSVERYIGSITRLYLHAVVVMTLLIGATYLTMIVALDRHALQQTISFLTASEFIRFQQLANQTRAVMRASADYEMPPFILDPMIEDVRKGVAEIREIAAELDVLHRRIGENLLEKLNPRDETSEQLRLDLDERLSDFLGRAERIVSVDNENRRRRYSFWGPIDFAASTDGALIRQFGEVILRAHDRSDRSIANAKLITSALLSLIAGTVVLASLFLFQPLLRKLRDEHRRTMQFETKLSHLAHTDALTGLANRSFFNQRLGELFAELERSGTGFSMLLIDLDRFKSVNDTLGHPAGDAVLRHVGAALQSTLRSGDFAARLGGDEFAVLLPGLTDPAALESIAQRISRMIATPFTFESRKLQATASIGGAMVPTHASEEAGLVRVTDLALYAAKAKRNTAVVFDDSSMAVRLEQNQLAAALALAAERDEYIVHYQPKVHLLTGEHLGFEALVRWRHPTLGLLPPGRFMPLMDGTDLIRDMTRRVVSITGRDVRAWKDAGLAPGAVSINLPEAMLLGTEGYHLFADVVLDNDIAWSDFAVEVTEDVFLNRNAEQIHATVTQFRMHGVKISLDDFGTGFASLVHLRDFPFDELKVDRSFVAAIGGDSRSEQIIRAIVDLSRNLGKTCVAEGIETDQQRRFLLEAGCEVGQGYLFAKPEPATDAEERLRHGRPPLLRSVPGGRLHEIERTGT